MATNGEKLERLCEFLADAFTVSDFRRFLTFKEYKDVDDAVSQNVGSTQYFFDVVQALEHRGLVDAGFFERLTLERPKKETEIRALRQLWLAEDPTGLNAVSTGTSQSLTAQTARPAASLDRATMVRTVAGLSPSDMAMFVTLIEGAADQIARHGTVREQAADLIRWAESSTGPGLAAIEKAYKDFRNPQ